ncbi:phenylalanine--tRNA ligase subunit beta [Paenibacillus sp. y28]|uniref:phenylalanine--tRNA ligase subunit beta n=1 Tax=Paenibacillus sp. y28 TaxID=3129110 RepID=UPI003015E245
MKVSYQWLSQYVDVSGYTAQELAEKLTRSGIEVDIVESRNQGVENVLVGYVKSREKHPDADKLSVCIVDVGQGEDLQIVCGAKNIAAGQKVPVAVVGAKLPGDFAIKRAKLRGVESMGMICSAKELGLNEKLLPKEQQEGILVLPGDTEIGLSILDVLAINDEVLELDLTPNRSDALSMLGAAYEIGAILGRPVKLPEASQAALGTGYVTPSSITALGSTSQGALDAADAGSCDPVTGVCEVPAGAAGTAYSGALNPDAGFVKIAIAAKEQCTLYTARLIEGVQVAASPLWLQNRLMAAGIRPINNIVDITNYVLLEYGQPLHAFDADKLAGGSIEVRFAREGETLVTLDDAERKLEPQMLVIADAEKAVALAGVMGGANTEVSDGTTRILLESAKFDGVSVRKTSRQLGLRSESSLRFEKEVNPDAVIAALNRAADLMAQLAGGQVADGFAAASTASFEPVELTLSLEKVNGYLGTELSLKEVKAIFERLNFGYEEVPGHALRIRVPNRRGDISRDVDLIEEVARLHGYDNIPTTLMSGVTTPGSLTRSQRIRRTIRQLLTDSGLHEVVTYSLTHPKEMAAYPGLDAGSKPIALAMPMSEDRSTLRTSLIPHLMDVAVYNRNRNMDDVAIFELGKSFLTAEESLTRLPQEKLLLSALLTGKRHGTHWTGKAAAVDFYDLKGVLDNVLAYLGVAGVAYTAAQPAGYHPGRTAEVAVERDGAERIVLGWIGQLHPDLQKEKDLSDTYVFELDVNAITEAADFGIDYAALPRFPAIGRDMAVVLDSSIPVGGMIATAREAAGELLESIEVFDIFTGERLGAGKKSVALALVYRHADRTLTDEEVSEAHGRVVTALENTYQAELRK